MKLIDMSLEELNRYIKTETKGMKIREKIDYGQNLINKIEVQKSNEP